MLARRVFTSVVSATPSASRQATRSGSTSASSCPRPPSSSLSAKHPSSPSSSPSPTPSSSRGRSKPHRSAVQVRPRPDRLAAASSAGFFAQASAYTSSAPAAPAASRKTEGRRRRSWSFLRSFASVDPSPIKGIFSQCQIPVARDYTFRPIPLYPDPLHLHLALTPSHQPIMANLGTERLLSPPRTPLAAGASPFDPPAPRSPLRGLLRKKLLDTSPDGMPIVGDTSSAMNDHTMVLAALSHPSLRHHLAAPTQGPLFRDDSEIPDVMRLMAESDVKHQLFAEQAFDTALAKLGDKVPAFGLADVAEEEVRRHVASPGEKVQMDEALRGLDSALARMNLAEAAEAAEDTAIGVELEKAGEADGEEMFRQGRSRQNGKYAQLRRGEGVGAASSSNGGMTVSVQVYRIGGGAAGEMNFEDISDLGVVMDSVKRKRKKKISKHKYQKRRKVSFLVISWMVWGQG